MIDVKKIYSDAYKQYGNDLRSILIPKGRQELRFHSLVKEIPANSNGSVLDFGCGLGHLFPYVSQCYPNARYHGVDIVDEFIQENVTNYGERFDLISSTKDIKGNYDYVVSAGVFNLMYDEDLDTHKKLMFGMISDLFEISNVFLSINMMTDEVDFQQEGAFHMNVKEMLDYVKTHFSKRVILDQSYMPYEFSLTIFKDQDTLKPDNIYRGLSDGNS